METPPECAVCLQAGASAVERTTCGHPFHRECLAAWAKIRPACPMCNRGLARALARGSVRMAADVDPLDPDTWPGEAGGAAVFGEEEPPPAAWAAAATAAAVRGPAEGARAALAEFAGVSACIIDVAGPAAGAVAVRGPRGLRAWEPAEPAAIAAHVVEKVATGILDALQRILSHRERFTAEVAPVARGWTGREYGDLALAAYSAVIEWRVGREATEVARTWLARNYVELVL